MVPDEDLIKEVVGEWGDTLATSASMLIGVSGWGATATGYPIYGPGARGADGRFIYGPTPVKIRPAPEEWLVQAVPDRMLRRLECLKCGAVMMVQERAIEQAGADYLAHVKKSHRCEETPRQGYKCEGCGKAAFYLKHKAIIGPECKIKKEDLWDADAKTVPIDCQFCLENIIIPKVQQIKIFDVKSGEEVLP